MDLRRTLGRLTMTMLAASLAGCARPQPGTIGPAPRVGSFSRPVLLEGRAVTLHLHRGDAIHHAPLIVYATGDGGWRGKDRDVFEQMVSWGYAAAGFSARDYLAHLRDDDGTTVPRHVALDLEQIINRSREALLLPPTVPVVLVGVSRGADLIIVAAGQPDLRPALAGVVAMGLTPEEEYVHRRRQPGVPLDLYAYLPRLGDLRLSVIQSSRDRYLPAAAARVRFGSDTPLRTLHAIDARNHSFAGARPRLYALLHDSLTWIERQAPMHGERP